MYNKVQHYICAHVLNNNKKLYMKYVIILDNSRPVEGQEKGVPIAGYTRSLGNSLHYSDELREFTVEGFMREIKYIQKKDYITQDQKSVILKNVLFLPQGKNVSSVYRKCFDKANDDFFLIDPEYPDLLYGILHINILEKTTEVLEHVNSIFANFSSLDFAIFSIFQSSKYNHEIKLNGQIVNIDKNWIDLRVSEKNVNEATFGPNSLDTIGQTYLGIEPFLDSADASARYSYPFIREKVLLINEAGLELAMKDRSSINRFNEIVRTNKFDAAFDPKKISNPFINKDPGKTNMRLGRKFDEYMTHFKKAFGKGRVDDVKFTTICNVRCGVIDKVLTFQYMSDKKNIYGLRYEDNSELLAKFVPGLVNMSGCVIANSSEIVRCDDVRLTDKVHYSEAQVRLYGIKPILDYFNIKGIKVKTEVIRGSGCVLHIIK